jgi:hypothetical protein
MIFSKAIVILYGLNFCFKRSEMKNLEYEM